MDFADIMTIQSCVRSDIVARNGFSLDRLTTLCAVVEAGTITAAAGPNLSRQSQFSRQIKELEQALGRALFVREGKTLRPTECGNQLARLARTFLGAVDALAKEVEGQPETLVIGAGEAVLRWLVVPQLGPLRQLSPPIHGQVRGLATETTVREVTLGRLDVGVIRADAQIGGLESQSVGRLGYVLAVPRRLLRTRDADDLYEGKPLAFAELVGGGQLASLGAMIAKEAGLVLNRVFQAETASLLLTAVEHEDAAAFLPLPAVTGLPQDRFALVALEGIERLTRELVIIWSREAFDQRGALRHGLRTLMRSLQQALAESRA